MPLEFMLDAVGLRAVGRTSEVMIAVRTPTKLDATDGPTTRSTRDLVNPGLSGRCLALYLFLIPVQFAITDSIRAAPSDAFLAIYLILRLPSLTIRRSTWTIWHALIFLSLLVGIVVAASHEQLTMYAIVNKGIGLITLCASYVAIVDFAKNATRVIWLSRIFLYGVLVNLIIGLVALYASNAGIVNLTFLNFSGVRLAGFLIDPNAFGGLLVAAAALHYLPRIAGLRILSGWPGFALSVLLPIGLVLTFSRSAWIGVATVLLVGMWRLGYRFARAVALGALAVGFAAILGSGVLFPNASTQINRSQESNARISILEDAYDNYFRNPVTGIGVGVSIVENGVQIHNTSAAFLTELGPLGLIGFLGLVWSYGAKGDRLSRSRNTTVRALGVGLLGAHVGVFGVSMGIDTFYQRYWWTVFALIGSLTAIERANATSSSRVTSGDTAALVPVKSNLNEGS